MSRRRLPCTLQQEYKKNNTAGVQGASYANILKTGFPSASGVYFKQSQCQGFDVEVGHIVHHQGWACHLERFELLASSVCWAFGIEMR